MSEKITNATNDILKLFADNYTTQYRTEVITGILTALVNEKTQETTRSTECVIRGCSKCIYEDDDCETKNFTQKPHLNR